MKQGNKSSKPAVKKKAEPGNTASKKKAAKNPGSPGNTNAGQFINKLLTLRSATVLKKYHRFFTFDEKSKKDTFTGVRMGQVFALAKEFMEMPPAEIEKLLESYIHEVRAGGCSIMARQASHKKTSESRLKELYELYLRRHDRINNWDLVDLAAYHVVGRYLENKPRKILYTLARSKNTWERRTAIVSTAHFIRQKDVEDTFKIAELLLKDKEETIHKATGWMLRFAGTVDPKKLLAFLDKYAVTMPRITLRAAIEHLSKKQREEYLSRK